jgi:hypothetical protein
MASVTLLVFQQKEYELKKYSTCKPSLIIIRFDALLVLGKGLLYNFHFCFLVLTPLSICRILSTMMQHLKRVNIRSSA